MLLELSTLLLTVVLYVSTKSQLMSEQELEPYARLIGWIVLTATASRNIGGKLGDSCIEATDQLIDQ